MTVSSVTELVTRATTPGYDILRASYAELVVTDLDASERFYVELLGMVPEARTDDALYVRGWEERQAHSLVLRRGDRPAVSRLGFRVRSEHDLDAIAADLAARGLPVAWLAPDAVRGAGRVLRVADAFGYPLEFHAEMQRVPTQLQAFHAHRGAPLLRFDHVNLHVPRLEEALVFWQSLGFRCSEYIATDGADERVTGAWMLRKPSVHDVALTAGRGPRLHHTAYWVGEPAGILRACDQLAAAGFSEAIERGPGRHGVSNAFFVYLRDPDGHRLELYSCDYYTGDPDLEPIRWSVNDRRCRSFWGTAVPDRWYEESTEVLGVDGAVLETLDADVDERQRRSEVLA